MSTIQESVLNKSASTYPTLLLCSFSKADGDYLSILLSNHLALRTGKTDRRIDRTENYFSTAQWLHYINTFDKQHAGDPSAIMRLALDEGYDTEQLYGLSFPLPLLQYVHFKRDFPDALLVIVYNEFMDVDEHLQKDISFVRRLVDRQEVNTILISCKWLIAQPIILLNALAGVLHTNVVKQEEVLPHSALSEKFLLEKHERLLTIPDKQYFTDRDYLFTHTETLSAEKFKLICFAGEHFSTKCLLQKLNQLVTLFAEPPRVIVYCEHPKVQEQLTALAHKLSQQDIRLSIEKSNDHRAVILNAFVQNREGTLLCIDVLHADFSYAELINISRQEAGMIGYPSVTIFEKPKEIFLHDLLTQAIPESGLFINTDRLTDKYTFDEHLNPSTIFWDLTIRLLSEQSMKCMAIPAIQTFLPKINAQGAEEVFAETYHQVLQKHHFLIEKSLDHIIEQLNAGNLSSLQEKRNLQSNVAKLQTVLLHSREELKSFQQLTAQLQQRIQYLENNWYQKIKVSVNRIKKIFFKKKSPGTGTLKRILDFIRFLFSKAGMGIFRKILKNIFRKTYLLLENRPVQIRYLDESDHENIFTYDNWIKSKLDREKQWAYYENQMDKRQHQPLISIIMPVYNTPLKFLKQAIESVSAQLYPHWELCIADDCSTERKVSKMLHTFSVKDKRIKVVYRKENGHISQASNDALALATGEYVLLFDHDDLLAANCLSEIALAVHSNPNAEIIYSDEDKISEDGTHQAPHFKPDWAPDHLLSRNYIGHVTVIKKSLIEKVKGFRVGFEGSQDYDLLLRVTEISNHIVHIPKVLYHWRIHQLSAAQGEDVKPYAYIAAKKALSEALNRRGLRGDVKYLSGLRGYRIDYEIETPGKISIIIPTKDQAELLKNTLDSIIEKTIYRNYEIIILNNNSTTKQLSDLLALYLDRYHELIKVVDAHFPFNFSKLMNTGVQYASGQYYLLLNNDVEVIHGNWLSTLLSYAQQERIGAVGARLLYPDDTIQHAGVVIGLGGIAGHTFVGAYKDEPGYFNYIQSVNNYSAVTAACLMVRKTAWEKVQGMDETFEVEYNDVDFCLKLYEAGYYNVYLPQVELYHYESATRGHPHQSKPSYERHLREMKLFKDKWQHFIDHDPFYNPNLNRGVHDFSMNFKA